ncbi:glycoside hydrolase family 78 protein [Phototrophicus methaneseepsis]|uniref:alpha-L-rhamnosidase n=1 Tax=Phototrophicus methaneseepsis TaxID=2710758 RepID=A0A7S8EBX6_9CHLR|nr:glycoside hydrolase family 78 protein [Phototrophicus methaneseepsis]QPC84160.1 glycoside hydrolase family 78 protein [Phototrophicus methaneseepsis]
MTEINHLICEYRSNPLGIDVTKPRLGWQMQTDRQGARQTAYRILAASTPEGLHNEDADLWDTGRIESDQSIHVPYKGLSLTSRQRVYWCVIVWDETDEASQSAPAWFEMGLLDQADWQAEWIGGELRGGPRSTIPAPYLRKSFMLPAPVQSARLYTTAIGLYECSMNGEIIGDDIFTPGWTDYQTRIQYQVYDVTELIHQGENTFGAILGDGWAVGHVGWGNRQQYYERPCLFAQLEVTLEDGSQHIIVTDASWKYHYGPLLENDFQMGESYDARLEMPGWNESGFNDDAWSYVETFDNPEVVLVATNGPTVKRIEEVKPISGPDGEANSNRPRYIFDMGQNMVGYVRLKGSAPAGTTVVLRFAEVLNPDGSLYTTNLRQARATDSYTFKGEGEEIWQPRFTFHGFRYVELNGYPGEVTTETITGVVVHSEMAQTGDFECSDPLLNQLQHNIVWGQKGNFVDVPTDCPQRDERLGWTGDIQVFVRTAAFNMDIAGFMTKWARDVRDAQGEAGNIPPVVPHMISELREDGGPAWADAAIICPWTIYTCYGDVRILEENYDVMKRYMDFIIEASPGYIRCAPDYEGWLGFGDWLSINADTPRDLIGTAFLAYDADLMSRIAGLLGYADDAVTYLNLFEAARQAFQNRFLAGTQAEKEALSEGALRMIEDADSISRGNLQAVDYGPIASEVFNTDLFTPTQTAYILALHFNLLPEDLRSQAVDELVSDIERRDRHLSTGFVGSPYLPHVLSENGRLDVAYALLNQKTWPSWLYAVTQGATTIWERWDGWTEENGFQDPGMNSFNHYAYGAIGAWLYNTVAGLEVDTSQPGYKHFLVQPKPGGGLNDAKATLKTLYGEVTSQWQFAGGTFKLNVTIPPNTSATVILPPDIGQEVTINGDPVRGNAFDLLAGHYAFKVM